LHLGLLPLAVLMGALNPKYATRLQVVKKSQQSSTGPASESGRALLRRLMGIRNQFPERVEQVDKQVRDAFERQVAILVLDMTGFSRLTVQHGIIHYLAMINEMEEAARPAVTGNGGTVIKQEADNLYAVYDDPAEALESSLDIFRAFDAVNTVVPLNRDIYGSIGIGYGRSLIIGEEDLFGSEVNFACKLGEDLAKKGEILLTHSAHAALPRGRYVCAPVTYEVSEMKIDCYRYERSLLRRK
jgi:class 3 adenylate cyclase